MPGGMLAPRVRLRLRATGEARIVNASRHGALIESASRLLPGRRCTVQWSATRRTSVVQGTVVRAEVSGLDAENVKYQGAIEFERPLGETWEDSTRDGHGLPSSPAGNVQRVKDES